MARSRSRSERSLALTILIAGVLAVAAHAPAQTRMMHLGARAQAMGGAFTGVADDATAFYWNPAGIAVGPLLSAGVYHGVEESRSDTTLFEQRATGVALGLTFLGVAVTSFEEKLEAPGGSVGGLDTLDVAVSILQSLPPDNLILAGNVHYLRGTVAPDGGPSTSSNSWDVDLALLYDVMPRLRLGLMARQLREARFVAPEEATAEGAGEVRLPRHARAGVSLRLPGSVLVAFDADLSEQSDAHGSDRWRELALGGEWGLFDERVFLRGGLSAEIGDRASGDRFGYSVGAGALVWILDLSASYRSATEGRGDGAFVSVTLAR